MNITRIHIVSNEDNDISAHFPNEQGYITIDWERDEKHTRERLDEFGRITLIQKKDGNIAIESERMSKEFVKKVFCDLIDKATLLK